MPINNNDIILDQIQLFVKVTNGQKSCSGQEGGEADSHGVEMRVWSREMEM